jgi:hypothetical protein
METKRSKSRSRSRSRSGSSETLSELFTNPKYRDIISVMSPYLGKRGRREMGKTSKKVFESMGGVKKAREDEEGLRIANFWDETVNQIIQDLVSRGLGMSFSTFKDQLKEKIHRIQMSGITTSLEEDLYLDDLMSDIDFFQSYKQKKLIK